MPKKEDAKIIHELNYPVPTKELRVLLYDIGIPGFRFSGDWTGKDITLVKHLFTRAYHIYKRDMRRGEIKEV